MSPWRGRRRFLAVPVVAVILASSGIIAQSTAKKEVVRQTTNDDEFARLVKEWTTKSEFLSPLVDHLPKVEGVPSPKDILGHYIGEPKKLTYYADVLTYYRALAANSPRVKVVPIGSTDDGRELVVVSGASADSIKNPAQYRRYLGEHAEP